MKGMGTNEDMIIKVIANRSNAERQLIIKFFKSSFGRDLIEDLKDELGGNFEKAVLALFKTPAEYDAYELFEAMDGAGTNEDTLIEIISSRTSYGLNQIKEVYALKYKVQLEADIIDETSGDLQKLLVSLLQCNRSENQYPDENQMRNDAQELFNAGEGQWGTDESVFNKLFTLRSHQELISIARHFHEISGKTIIDTVNDEFSGDIKRLLKAILHVMINPAEFFASRVNHAVKGWGTNDNLLIRVLVSRDEIDMPQIKQAYQIKYGKNMLEDIKDDCSGDYKNLLVELASH